MNILGGSIEGAKQDAVELILSNPKGQAITASMTTGIAIDASIMSWLPQTISIIGGLLGIVLTTMMIAHKYVQIKRDLKDT